MLSDLQFRLVPYRDLINVSASDEGEHFVSTHTIPAQYDENMDDMKSIFSGAIPVRKTVAEKLERADLLLKETHPELGLYLTYGYRSLEVQTKKFLERLSVLWHVFYPDPIDLYEEIHKTIAVPTVAWHPTGWAVDVLLYHTGTKQLLDFWTPIYDYSIQDRHFISYDQIGPQAIKNRLLLRKVMMEVGFAPYDGEYRHFSYGDKERANYYAQPAAIYEQVSVKRVLQDMGHA